MSDSEGGDTFTIQMSVEYKKGLRKMYECNS